MRDQIDAVDIPVMADGDTGFGNALDTFHAARLMEAVQKQGAVRSAPTWSAHPAARHPP